MLVKLICLFVLSLSLHAFAGEIKSPDVLEGGRVVTAEEAKAYFDSGKALFVDVRNPLNYGKGHIPTAIAAPFAGGNGDGLSRLDFLRKLPADKGARIIFYSHGETGWKSYNAASEAIKAGYANVMWMREGFTSWEKKNFEAVSGPESR
ncbi:MAG: rhodanese-like domain-containing protein [Deltaproteobacteria bacterium]|nr:rhodanese-like domain-containing protein [Deltaproteobacteria bacterium]